MPLAFETLDADANGSITREEWEGYGRTVHGRIDANGDGLLDAGEIGGAFAVFDLDGDGALTTDEVHFPLLDRNRDGVIVPAEWDGDPVLRALVVERSQRVTPEAVAVRRHITFTELDRNATGRISRDEIEGTPPFTLFWL